MRGTGRLSPSRRAYRNRAPGPRPRRLAKPYRSELDRSWRQHRLPEHLAVDKVRHGFLEARKRQNAVLDRFQLALSDATQKLDLILARPTVAADDVELERPDIANVGLWIIPGGRAAS